MKSSKATIFLLLAATAAVHAPLWAQSVSDPVYAYIDRWEAMGYLEPQYTLRPYSPEVVRAILERVAGVAGGDDAEAARAFLERYAAASLSVKAVHRSDARLGGDTVDYRGETGVGFDLVAQAVPGVWTQGVLDVIVRDGYEVVKPETERAGLDIHSDGAMNFMPDGLSGDPMAILYGLSSSTWFGSGRLWGSASYAKSSAGPFFTNGIVIGPQAHAAPNWTLNAATGAWRFSAAVYQLTASSGGTEKYLAYHSYSFAPTDRLDLGIFESTVWGGAFKPTYLVPLSMLYYLQSLSGFSDNSLAGLYGTWRPVDGIQAKASVFFDDVGFSDLVKFDLDTKIIGAAQAGLTWAPESGAVGLVSLDYTAIFPYMYAHRWTAAEDDYTHYGDSFGAALQPNSDRWELRARFMPASAWSAEAVSRLIRHGNASAGITDGDGTWFDDGWDGNRPTYQEPYEPGTSPEYFRFLSQDVLETTFQIGASVSYAAPIGKTRLSITARYLLEAVWNDGLVQGDNNLFHYLGLDASWSL